MLDHCSPTVFHVTAEVFILHIVELDFLVFILGAVQHATGIGIEKTALLLQWCTLQLMVRARRPVFVTQITNLVLHLNDIAATSETV